MGDVGSTATRRARGAAIVAFGAMWLVGASAQPARAADIRVDSTADAPDVKPGDHHCRTAAATCTLRLTVRARCPRR